MLSYLHILTELSNIAFILPVVYINYMMWWPVNHGSSSQMLVSMVNVKDMALVM